MYFGNEAADYTVSTKTRYYAPTGNIEIDFDKATNKYIVNIFVDGDPYSASIVQRKENNATNLYYLHRDYLGSILAITNNTGNIVEKRHFDAWGNTLLVQDGQNNNLQKLTFLERGYTGHEHLQGVDLINMNARLYDAKLHRFLATDNFIQDPGNSQNYNLYGYGLNNPLKFTDPSGEIVWAAVIVGAVVGAYIGGAQANQNYNPFQWNYSSGKTWGYMLGGAIVGGVSGGLGSYVAGSGATFANTWAIVSASVVNSIGTNIYTGGKSDFNISFGIGSINFSSGNIGFLGKKGNSFLENLGYGLGAIANISDVLAGLNPGKAELQTENLSNSNGKDKVGHTQLNYDGEVLIDFGPTGDWMKFEQGRNDWVTFASNGKYKFVNDMPGNRFEAIDIKGVNVNRLYQISNRMNSKPGFYQVFTRSCSSTVSRALSMSGVPAIGIHPYILHSQMYLRNIGVRPIFYLNYFNEIK